MNLTPYVDNVRHQLAAAAETGGDDVRELADRLSVQLESAIRLMLLDALSAAADAITLELAPGSVELRLRTGEPEFVVTAMPDEEPDDRPPAAPTLPTDEAGAAARINLRLPEQLKTRVEEAARTERLSVNAWLVRAAAAALAENDRGHRSSQWGGRIGQTYTGWVR